MFNFDKSSFDKRECSYAIKADIIINPEMYIYPRLELKNSETKNINVIICDILDNIKVTLTPIRRSEERRVGKECRL